MFLIKSIWSNGLSSKDILMQYIKKKNPTLAGQKYKNSQTVKTLNLCKDWIYMDPGERKAHKLFL